MDEDKLIQLIFFHLDQIQAFFISNLKVIYVFKVTVLMDLYV